MPYQFDSLETIYVQSSSTGSSDNRNASRIECRVPERKLSEICKIISDFGLDARLEGKDRSIRAVNTLENAADGELSFLSNPRYTDALRDTRASAVVLKEGFELPNGLSAIRCDDPYAAITVAIINIHGYRNHPQWGISDQAMIDPSAKIGANANIAGGVTIGAGACVGDNCTLYPGCYIADRVRIGHDATLYPNVAIYNDSEIGNRVTIHAGSVIGQDGLGFAPHNEKWIKIPQVGKTIIGDEVEIGANCAIDRATLGTTEIGSGTKFGNVVVIGHGTKIGPDCLFVGLVGIAGSVKVGRHVTLAGQVGVAGHVNIGDDVRAGAQSGIAGNVEEKSEILGVPAMPLDQAKRSYIAIAKLPEWIKRVREGSKSVDRIFTGLSLAAAILFIIVAIKV